MKTFILPKVNIATYLLGKKKVMSLPREIKKKNNIVKSDDGLEVRVSVETNTMEDSTNRKWIYIYIER